MSKNVSKNCFLCGKMVDSSDPWIFKPYFNDLGFEVICNHCFSVIKEDAEDFCIIYDLALLKVISEQFFMQGKHSQAKKTLKFISEKLLFLGRAYAKLAKR